MRSLLFLSCFLIISCDLPSEANKDCSGIEGGLAEIDDCGVCDGNNANLGCDDKCFSDAELDECGVCNGNNVSCSDCLNVPNGDAELDECDVCDGLGACACPDEPDSCDCCCPDGEVLDCFGVWDGPAILDDCETCNGETFFGTSPGDVCGCTPLDVIDGCGICNGNGFLDCMCTPIHDNYTYIDTNDDFNCDTQGSPPYTLGEQLSCETLETEFDICYPSDCESFKLADFEDKIIFIIYEEDWWDLCYDGIPQLEANIILPYLDNPNVAIINILADEPGIVIYNCETWGNRGDNRVPIIINDYEHSHTFGDWFGITWSSPWYLLIDQNFVYQASTQSESEAEYLLEEMLTNME